MKRIVLLVDNKRRDLRSVALLVQQLRHLGCQPFVEPLEAWRGVLAAYHPDVMVFNHLTASHLANYSARLKGLGVKVAVLPNESLIYDPEALAFNCRRRNPNAHVDVYFCWSEVVRDSLLQNGMSRATRLEVLGNPKFDFYFEPWSKLYRETGASPGGRPRLLFCTNFGFAKYQELPPVAADKLFALWSQQIPSYANYWDLIRTNYRCRDRVLDFIATLLRADKYALVLRPHPGEPASFYQDWIQGLPPQLQRQVRLAADDPIHALILNCDLEISCETCTTALESWLCHKPTLELVFEKHPLFYHPEVARLNVECHCPEDLVPLVDQQLAHPEQTEFQARRQAHLKKWCASPNGTTCARIAQALAEVAQEAHPDFSRGLGFADYRRACKLKALQALHLPYNFDPLLRLKARLMPRRYWEMARIYEKTVKPADVARADAEMAACLPPPKGT